MASLHNPPPYYEWISHSNFSFLTGVSHPEEYIRRAAQLGYQGLGLCDYDGLYGIVRAYRAHKRLEHPTPFRLFYGSELHLNREHHLPVIYRETLICYALNMTGYHNLCRLISRSHQESKREAFLDFSSFCQQDLRGLVILIPMRGLIRTGKTTLLKQRLQQLKELAPRSVYMVISRHLNPAEDCWISPSLQLAAQIDLPLLFSQDCYFHAPENKDLSDLVQAIRINKQISQAIPYMFVNDERCLKDPSAIVKRYQVIPGYSNAITNSLDLAERFDFRLDELRYQYPKEMIPEGFTAHGYLEHLVWQNAYKRYGPKLPEPIKATLNKELALVDELLFADYFLTVWDIVCWARKQGILCQGRGSAANSAICYVLGITAVDPSQFDLLFERFISVERGDPPDIDVDFEHERREEVIQYVYEHYGRGRAAMVANVITFRSRGAIRFTGKALGIPDEILSQASSLQKLRLYRQGRADENIAALNQQDKHLPLQLWANLSQRLKGYPRHMGIHSGGFVLTEEGIDRLVPQEPATMPRRTVVQWSKDDLEELGFFKIDLLALGMLTVVRKALQTISFIYKKPLELKDIPHSDRATYDMIQKANTVGTFQIESRAQMSMLPRLRPRCLYDLVVQVGIIRPGPIQGGLIHPFLRRRDGLEPVIYAHPKLKPILQRTLGVPIFQEQVMRIAMAIGDFSAGEADQLRKQIGAWSLNKDLGSMVKQLEKGMRKNGIAEVFIEQMLGQLQGFASYGFPESHAVSFALIAYASSWLKCHYPAAFFAALLNSQPMGFYSRHALIQAAKRDGVSILPICVNHSQWDAQLEPLSKQKDYGIRLGFNQVRGLRRQGAQDLIALRAQNGAWHHLEDFLRQAPLYRQDLTSLAAANALFALGAERRSALWIAEAAPYAPLVEENLDLTFPEESSMLRAERDFAAFGTSLAEHPAWIIKNEHWLYPFAKKSLLTAQQLLKQPANLIIKVFGMVLVRQAPSTAKGMVFITLEDETGFLNLAFTPQIYERYSIMINSQGFLCVEGRLQKAMADHSNSILVKKVYSPQLPQAEVIPMEHEDKIIAITRKTLARTRNYM